MSVKRTLWKKSSTKDKNAVLVGYRIADAVIDSSVPVVEVRFTGELLSGLRDLWQAAGGKKNFPVSALRTAISINSYQLISVDKDLGFARVKASPMRFFAPSDAEDSEDLKTSIYRAFKSWNDDVLQPWAERNELGNIGARVDEALRIENLVVSPETATPIRNGKSVDFPLLVHLLAKQLAGEELFPGLDLCEIVASEKESNSIDLMTKPVLMPGRRPYFYSMVARLTVATVPFSSGYFLVPGIMKRVWANKLPESAKVMRKFAGYVYSPGRMVVPITVVYKNREWVMGDDYACAQIASKGFLPGNLKEIVESKFEGEMAWWAGIPQLTTIYGANNAKSVFECDEIDLMQVLRSKLEGHLEKGGIKMRTVDLDRQRAKPKLTMLTETDLTFCLAGDDSEEDEVDEGQERTAAEERARRILELRKQNQMAISLSKNSRKRVLWVFCDGNQEAKIIEALAEVLFGKEIEIHRSSLPEGVHGLKTDLPGGDLKMDERFDLRVQAWDRVAQQVKEGSLGKLPVVLICASKKYGQRFEEELNMYAGIHAMSRIGANVHHLLPIENKERQDDRDHFVHRTQSALMDVILAHSGIVFGVDVAISSIYGEAALPKYIYGIQSTRSRGRKFTSEVNVNLIIYSRISVSTGITEIKFACRKRSGNTLTDWIELSDALSWLGSQRDLYEGKEDWLKTSFASTTKQVLQEIMEDDPRGVVMIDWGTTSGLWVGISDADLMGKNQPMLDGVALSLFGDLSFIRIRRDKGTMSLRQKITNSYHKLSSGENVFSGETSLHNYYTTMRSLVEVMEYEVPSTVGRGTFIGTMGYAKTVQVPRGFSCYRPMKRFKKAAEGKDYYEEDQLEVGDLTAALPAPSDYTVLQCPTDLSPEQVAAIPLSLRIGFAHYDDWTSLPAPLFFMLKVRDYIIRYNQVEEEAEEVLTAEITIDISDSADNTPSQLKLELKEEDLTLDLRVEQQPDEVGDNSLVQICRERPKGLELEETLQFVKDNAFVNLWISDNPRLFNKYKWLIRTALSGAPKVKIQLPYFVDINAVLGDLTPLIKRNLSQIWRDFRGYDLVVKTQAKPSNANFLKVIARGLWVPQGLRGIGVGSVCVGRFGVEPLWTIVNSRYNPTVAVEDRVAREDFSEENFVKLADFAIAKEDDEMLGWLIFTASQLAAGEYIVLLEGKLKMLPGPMTEEALNYHLDCIIAAKEIELSQDLSESKFNPIVISNREPPSLLLLEDAVNAKSETTSEDLVIREIREASPVSGSQPAAASSSGTQGGFKLEKQKFSALLESLEPGQQDFDEKISSLELILAELRNAHETSKAQAKEIADKESKRSELELKAKMFIDDLEKAEDLSIQGITFIPVEPDDHHQARLVSVEKMRDLLKSFVSLASSSDYRVDFRKLPLTSRANALKKQQEITIHMTAAEEELRLLVAEADFLDYVNPEGDPDGGNKEEISTDNFPAQPPDATEPILEQAPALQADIEEKASPMEVVLDVVESWVPNTVAVEDESLSTEREKVPVSDNDIEDSPDPAIEQLWIAATLEQEDERAGVEEEAAPEERLDPNAQILTLEKLVEKRYYGLAGIHASALRIAVSSVFDSGTRRSIDVACAMVTALEKMDCLSDFEVKVEQDLMSWLDNQEISSNVVAGQIPQCLGVLAAGLSGMLFDVSENAWRIGNAISNPLTKHKNLYDLVDYLVKQRQRGIIFTREQFLSSKAGEQLAFERETERFKRRAAEWKTCSDIFSNWNHSGYRKVHELIFGDKGIIGQALGFIGRDDLVRINQIREDLFRKLEKPHATLEEYWKRVEDRTRPEGLYRDRAIENIDKTRVFIQAYLDHVVRRSSQSKPNSSMQQIMLSLDRKLREAEKELAEVEMSSPLDHLFLHGAKVAIGSVLQLFDENEGKACIPQSKQKLLLQLPMDASLTPQMEANPQLEIQPLCLASTVLEEVGRLSDEDLDGAGDEKTIDELLAVSYKEHLINKRFLPAYMILAEGITPGGDPIQQLHKRARDQMEAELKEARQRVTHAMTLDALPQNVSSQMQRIIESLLEALHSEKSIGHPGCDSYPDYPFAVAVLRQHVLDPLELHLSEAQRKLRSEIQRISEEGLVSQQDIQRILDMIRGGNAASLRTAHDALSMLKNSKKFPSRMSIASDHAKEFESFMREVHETCKPANFLPSLVERLKREPSADDEGWISGLDEAERLEASELIEGFLDLMNNKKVANNIDSLNELLRKIGIALPADYLHDTRPNRAKFSLNPESFVFPTSADDDMFIPPDLGSWATSIQGFALYGNHHENELRQLMQEVSSTPTLVLTRSRLSMKSRAKITNGYPALLLDEYLLAYVALHPNERLQSFMRVAILTYSTNPFDDYGGRPVPQEMFFGRQNELGKLRSTKSIGVLYGGRRLGKSSLLSKIDQEMKKAPNSSSAYISMETVPTEDHVAGGWDFIYENLVVQGIIQPSPHRLTKWEQVRSHIQNQILARKNLNSLYLLLDECDGIMSSELSLNRQELGFVRSLQQMLDNVSHQCNVRTILAGLHNMARMTSEENSVLGKADTISLKPFSSSSEDLQRGIQLIVKPLAALGYLFPKDKQDLPLRIMSVCNFYPAFIQLYCKCLVDTLSNNRQDAQPPYEIKESDLDAVEKDEALLTVLREKFELNLNLDKRYKAIALFLAEIYYSDSSSGIATSNGLTVSELRTYCSDFASKLFSNTGQGAFEALLDEMCELNVLEKIGSRFTLRNPHIAMMMGDRARVSAKIDELSTESPDRTRNHGERRPSYQQGNVHFTFPMPYAWVRRQRDVSDGQLFVLTGNEVSGFKDLGRIGREGGMIGNSQRIVAMPGKGVNSANEYFAKLRRAPASGGSNSTTMLVVPVGAWKPSEINEWITVAQKAVRFNTRIILLAIPENAAEISRREESGELEYDDKRPSWKVVYVAPWSRDAVFFKLHEKVDIAENDAAIQEILEATCGFGHEIEKVCNHRISAETVGELKNRMRREFAPTKKLFYENLGISRAFSEEHFGEIEQFLGLVNGERRLSAEIDECREMFNVSPAECRFLTWMGLLQEADDGLWKVPDLYLELIGKAA